MNDERDDTPEPDKRARQLLDELQKLSTRVAADFFALGHRINQARDAADGSVFSGGDNSTISTEPRPDSGSLLYDLVKMQLETTNRLLDFSQRHADVVTNRVQRMAIPFTPVEKRVTRLETECSNERAAKWEVYVHNAARKQRNIRLRPLGEWTDEDGTKVAPCAPKLATTSIPARCELKVQITHDPVPQLMVDRTYVATVELVLEQQVVGHIQLGIRVVR